VVFINESSNVAVCTLWTKKEVVLRALDELGVSGKVHAVGTLYTVYGINYLLRTLARRPQIDTLVVYGADLSGSGEALIRLFTKAVAPRELAWPLEEVEPLVKGVKVVDLRAAFKLGDRRALAEAVNSLYKPSPPKRAVSNLELPAGSVESWPLPVSGLLVQDTSLFRAWVKLVHAVMVMGTVKESEYGERQKQLLNVVAVLRGASCLEPQLLSYFRRESFEEHFDSLLTPGVPGGVSYTYGERLVNHPIAGDQLSLLVDRLRSSPATRRAVAVLWDHQRDHRSGEPPCILLIQGDVTDGLYNHTVYLRSSDAYGAWPLNAYGQVKLAELIARMLRVKAGSVTLISCSAHVYEHDWSRAWELVHEHYGVLKEFSPDPRGSVLIEAGESGAEVELRAPDGRPALRLPASCRSLRPLAALLSPDHALYLGWEAGRAAERVKRGIPYAQDEE